MTTPDPIPDAEVAGLIIPADLAAQIITAFREMYPTLTEGKDDETAVRACLVWFITSTLETVAARRARAQLDQTIQQLSLQTESGLRERGDKIKEQVARIKEKPVLVLREE